MIIIRFKHSVPQNFGNWYQDSYALIQRWGDRGPALVHVFLNVQNKMRKVIKYEACRTFYRFFRREFNVSNITGARMLDYIYPLTLK